MFPMQNNPIMAMVQAMQRGGNPMQVLGSMGGNPQIAQFMKMINGKSGQQLQQMAENMARDRGIDIDELARQLGMKR